MSDLISRQYVIDYINRAIPEWSADKEIAIDCIKNSPSPREEIINECIRMLNEELKRLDAIRAE